MVHVAGEMVTRPLTDCREQEQLQSPIPAMVALGLRQMTSLNPNGLFIYKAGTRPTLYKALTVAFISPFFPMHSISAAML